MEKDKSSNTPPPAEPAAAKSKSPASSPAPVPPLFRRIDWLALIITFAVIWVAYFLTLAPELTLEDSGELCTASYYAGIPHPPGYPFWAIYSWLWTVFLPVGNVAWRVEVGQSTAEAMACGLVAFMVSRGSSMLMEGIEELKGLTGKWENLICLISGTVAGLMLGLGSVMWSESVAINRISLFGVPWVMLVLLCLMRWIYAPHQRRYLFCAMFFFGICSTIHQTLLVAAMGIEASIAATHPRLGRNIFLGNSIIYLAGMILNATGVVTMLNTSFMVLAIYHIVGVGSLIGYAAFAIITEEKFEEFCLDGAITSFILFSCLSLTQGMIWALLAFAAFCGFVKMAWATRKLGLEWLVVIACGLLWVLGASFYFYEPLSGMTNPPMQWGYPRTVEGFFHALSRGQYEKANPTNVFGDPGRFMMQLGILISDIAGEFNWVCVFIALVPLLFFFKMQKRERSWILCLTTVYLCIGVLLIILMNPSLDRQSSELNKVFFGSSHGVVAIMFGYGLALTAAFMATHYQKFRLWGFVGGGIAALIAVFCLWQGTGQHYRGPAGEAGLFELPRLIHQAFGPNQYGLPIVGNLVLVCLPFIFLLSLAAYRQRAPLAITLGVFILMPLYSGLSHWGSSEQRNHWFGYWFGHDMFTPPFVAADGKLSYDAKAREEALKGPHRELVYPEMTRDAILFGGTDPGRFCPTYMIFCESFIPHNCQPVQDQHFDRRDVYIITQNALADGTYLNYIRAHYFRSDQYKYDSPFFLQLLRTSKEREDDYKTNFVARLAYDLLDKPFTSLGAKIEARRRQEGVYPPKEIYIPTPEDSQKCFSDYYTDAQRRLMHDQQYPTEPKQIKPGEGVNSVDDHGQMKLQISGQISVMAINGLLTKVIFDHNLTNEFFVEESFPLDWMYPHLTPFGNIMKINRNPLPELTEDIVRRDHEFWAKYSERFIGNWITYDTSVADIVKWIEKTYLRHDYNGFTGDLKFIRDDQAQKAFSKLRSSIGGIYAWRLGAASGSPTPPQYMPKNDAERARMYREADFTFRQAFALCPYSPEAVYRYIQLLMDRNNFRLDDALLVAETCSKLDPYNGQITGLVKQLQSYKQPSKELAEIQGQVSRLEQELRAKPEDYQKAFELASKLFQLGQNDRAMEVLDHVVDTPNVPLNVVYSVAQAYVTMNNLPKVEFTMEKLAKMAPADPEALYNLAAIKATLGKTSESLQALRAALDLNAKRLAQNPKARDLRAEAAKDAKFGAMQTNAEFQALISHP